MWKIRPVKPSDSNALFELAESLGPGMTTFPADRAALSKKAEISAASFSGQIHGSDVQYLMALEDISSSQVLGVSAVYPKIGHPFGFFSYHVDRIVQHSPKIEFGLDCGLLNLSNAYTGYTEVGTLAVKPNLRRTGAGKMLAKARYLLMGCFPDLFAPKVIAEMRGWQDNRGNNPFWSAIGEKFFRMEFARADAMSALEGAEFITNLIPRFPIYLDLLPQDARNCIGRPHDSSAIAMAMLIDEGFRFENYIDVFDAGPQVVAPLTQIKTVREIIEVEISNCMGDGQTEQVLVANPELSNFCVAKATMSSREATIRLPDAQMPHFQNGMTRNLKASRL